MLTVKDKDFSKTNQALTGNKCYKRGLLFGNIFPLKIQNSIDNFICDNTTLY